MYENIGRSLGTDYFRIADQLTAEERDYWRRTRDFVDDEVLPVINDYWERAEFPWPLVKKLGKLGVVGDGIEGYGCPPLSPIATGLVHMELNRGDGSLGTFLGVQAGLAMQSIALLGSEEQKRRWLPPMAALEKLGAFALTEPLHGSDSVALETSARRDGDTWILNGAKKWIGNGTIADVTVLWARDVADGKVKGFLVEKGAPGYDARRIDGKGSLRAVWQAEITLTDVRVPEAARLPGARSFKDAGRVLAGTRNTVAWGALGHATAAFDAAAAYCRQRTQFGKPLVSFQIVQERLVKMLAELCGMQLYCLRLGRLIEKGRLSDTIAALAKMNNTSKARQVILEARDLLGGNGILLDFHVMRHLADMEAIHTTRAPRRSRLSSSEGTSPVWARSRNRRSLRQISVDGVRLRVSVRGTGRPLLLLMGIGGNLEMWAPFEDALNGRVVQTITVDAPGTGGSTGYRWPRRMGGLAHTMERMLDALDFPQVDVLGVSFGGVLAQQLAHQAPDRVRRLVLAATGPGLGGVPGSPRVLWALATPRRYWQPDYFRRIAGTIYGGAARRDPDSTLHGSLARFTHAPSMTGYVAQLYAIAGWTSLPWLPRLRQPTLVLAGDDDPIVPLINGRILHRLIPHARLHIVPGGGHLFLLEDPAEIAALVTDFLA